VTLKNKAISDDKHGQLRLSKGFNLEESKSDFILPEYETRPDGEIENIQQVRGVWNSDE
jgi:putative transposase